MGAVDSLIVWENLSVTRYVLRSSSSNGRYSHFKVLIVLIILTDEIDLNPHNIMSDCHIFKYYYCLPYFDMVFGVFRTYKIFQFLGALN